MSKALMVRKVWLLEIERRGQSELPGRDGQKGERQWEVRGQGGRNPISGALMATLRILLFILRTIRSWWRCQSIWESKGKGSQAAVWGQGWSVGLSPGCRSRPHPSSFFHVGPLPRLVPLPAMLDPTVQRQRRVALGLNLKAISFDDTPSVFCLSPVLLSFLCLLQPAITWFTRLVLLVFSCPHVSSPEGKNHDCLGSSLSRTVSAAEWLLVHFCPESGWWELERVLRGPSWRDGDAVIADGRDQRGEERNQVALLKTLKLWDAFHSSLLRTLVTFLMRTWQLSRFAILEIRVEKILKLLLIDVKWKIINPLHSKIIFLWKITVFPNKTKSRVRQVTLFYIFPNFVNVWLIIVGLVSASIRNLF